jgi:RNA polymerase sigma-70 factor (ECF subfamily)
MSHRALAEASISFAPRAASDRAPGVEFRETESLVERLSRGSLQALGEAYDLYHEPLRAFSRRLLGDDATAEDLVQETFVEFFRAVGRYDRSCSLKTFLISIAANRAKHHFRSAGRRRAAMARLERDDAETHPPTPEEEVGRSLWADALLRLLERLPAEQRIAFVLCEVEEKTSGEAAAIVGASEATVRSRLWHAKRKLRRALAQGGWK